MKFASLLLTLFITSACESLYTGNLGKRTSEETPSSSAIELRLYGNNGSTAVARTTTHVANSEILVPGRVKPSMVHPDNKVFAGWCSSLPCVNLSDRTHLVGEVITMSSSRDLYALWLDPAGAGWESSTGNLVIPNGETTLAVELFYFGSLSSVVIPDSMTSVGDRALSYMPTLTQVTLPDSLEEIKLQAFYTNALTKIIIPSSVTRIEERAFSQNQLTEVILTGSNMYIGNSAFSYNQISNLEIRGSVLTIENYAFGANPLDKVTISGSIPLLTNGVFAAHGIRELHISGSVETITYGSFSANNLTELHITGSVKEFGMGCFSGNQITALTLPQDVHTIRDGAFSANPLTSVILPDSLHTLGPGAFDSNPISSVTIGAGVTVAADAIANDFATAYNNAGMLAGTYTWDGASWTLAQ